MADASDAFDERRLLAGLAAGQERAFAALYDRYGSRLYRTARRLLQRPDEAEDCVQDVFAALVLSRSELVHVRQLPAYLFAVLRRQVARRNQQVAKLPQSLSGDCPAPRPHDDPRREALTRAIQSLPEEQRTVIGLKIEGELTFAEIGRVLAISPNTAASRYRYALERLRERLQNE